MRTLETQVVTAMGAPEGHIASLRTHDLRDGFHAWHGASGRRYVASVFAVDARVRDAGLPAFEAFVLIAVARDGARRRVRAVVAVEWGSARHRAVAAAIADGVDEWHVHLLGASRDAREAIAADLRAGAGLGTGLARAG